MNATLPRGSSTRAGLWILWFLGALALCAAPGCLAPQRMAPAIGAQRDALTRLQRASAEDHAALCAALTAILNAQRERLLARLQLEIEAQFLTPDLRPDLVALDRALQEPPPHAAAPLLTAEIRSGRATRDQIAALIADFAAAEALSDPSAYRRAALARLGPIRDHDAASAAMRSALDARAADAARLFADALDSNASLQAAAGASPAPDLAAREAALQAWRLALVSRLSDPAQRDAAERLARTLLDLFASEPDPHALAALPEANR